MSSGLVIVLERFHVGAAFGTLVAALLLDDGDFGSGGGGGVGGGGAFDGGGSVSAFDGNNGLRRGRSREGGGIRPWRGGGVATGD
jgi:hypothetical protein